MEGILANAASHLVASAKVGGEQDSQQTFLLQLLRELTRAGGGAEVDLRRIAEAVKSPEETGWPTPISSSRRPSARSWPASSMSCCTAPPPACTAAGPASTWTPSVAPRGRARRR